MISIDLVDIASVADFDKLNGFVSDPLYNIQSVIKELKSRVGTRATRVLVEYPYSDLDYNSVYSSFYTKQHKKRPKDCYRLHIFSGEELDGDCYRGYLVLRPSFAGLSLGRGYLDPRLLLDADSAYVMQSRSFFANLGGDSFSIATFPWMAQETDVAICAHSAVWSIVRYFSQKYPHHQQLNLDDVVQMTPAFLNRKVPSDGLNFLQISSILSQAGFHCLFLSKDVHGADKMKESLKIYIESGIPMVAGMKRKEHAVVLVGHGRVDHGKLPGGVNDYTLSSSLIDSLIAVDDNYLPYIEVGETDNFAGYNINDIDNVIVPLYEKMFLPADIMLKKVKDFIDKGGYGFIKNPVLRPYLTSSRSLKRKASLSQDMPDCLKDATIAVEMPKFVWCVDISSEDEYRAGLNSARIILDATAGTYDPNPWLLVHNGDRVTYYDREDSTWRNKVEKINPYAIYENNLERV